MDTGRTMNGYAEWDRAGAQGVYDSVRSFGEMSDRADKFDRFVNTLGRIWKKEYRKKLYMVSYFASIPLCLMSEEMNGFLKVIMAPFAAFLCAFFVIGIAYVIYLGLLLVRSFFVPWATKRYENRRGAFDDYLRRRDEYADIARSGYSAEAERAEMERYMSNNQNYQPGPGRQWATKV